MKKYGEMLGVKVNLNRIDNYDDDIDFENNDIVFFNVGEIKVMPDIIKALKKHIKNLTKFVEDNKPVILIGTTGCVMAKRIIRKNGEFEGLGILDMDLVEREKIYGDDILFTLNERSDMEIVGSQIKMLDTFLHSDISLGTLLYGSGNNGFKRKQEGARYKNVIYTNALGPVFIKNPWWTELIIKHVLENKGLKIEDTENIDYELEINSLNVIKKFIEKKGEKNVS